MASSTAVISVIMPARNSERTIGDAIKSVLGQTFPEFELIVCDDASADKTSEVAKSIKDIRIKYIRNKSRLGAGTTRDQAIEMATGDWIAFIDADDIWQPHRLERLIAAADSQQDVIVFDDLFECHDGPKGLVPWKRVHGPLKFGGDGNRPVRVSLADFIYQKRIVIQPLFPRSAVEQNGLKHPQLDYAEDTDYVLRLIESGLQLLYVPEPMYWYRITPSSLSSNRERSKLMMKVLGDAMQRMRLDQAESKAFRRKIDMLSRDVLYEPFLWEIKDRHWFKALKLAVQEPVIMFELIKRLAVSVPYRFHRLFHRAQGR